MLFNSFAFLLVFLPAALLVHWLVDRFRPGWRPATLVLLSLAFYGYWDIRFLPILLFSVTINWIVGEAFQKTHRRILIPIAIGANLLTLGIFKYFNFFADLAALIPGFDARHLDIALPLGISFFTFHHIMYLVDLRAGVAPRLDIVRYALYISFFPQILAGPLVRWREVIHQFDERPYGRSGTAERIARGAMLFVLGLAKKAFLGDPLAEIVNPIFQAAAQGAAPTVLDAWQAALGFTFQIYFDFSGYTDMALGLSLLFGIVLPQNFDVPYRAASLQDFWRRWHMTLSRFLRDYLYIPLGGSRRGLIIQLRALFATMALGGLWHGAGLTFVAWGCAHGIGLGGGALWRKLGLRMPVLAGWTVTFAFVVLTWVLFRATSFTSALLVYKSLFGFAPLGAGFQWHVLAIAFLIALTGPTAWTAVYRAPPWRFAAVGFSLLFVLILFKVGSNANYEFIYFQF